MGVNAFRASSTLLAWALVAACASPRTEVVVVTDSDLSMPDEIDEMAIGVVGPQGSRQAARATLGPGDPLPPRTLGLVWDGGPLGPFVVTAQAMRRGTVVVERRAVFEFQPQRTLLLRMHLTRDCVGRMCAEGQTCAAGACRSVDLEPSELEPLVGPLPSGDGVVGDGGLRRDAGAPTDAGPTDAGLRRDAGAPTDAGPTDAGAPTDAGPTDAGCSADLSTDPENCGLCGRVCSLANATADCRAGVCVVDSCSAGFDDCDGNPANGCEADLSRPMTCGSCANTCRGGTRECCAGVCENRC